MLRRLNIIEFTQSFVGREDFALEDKLSPRIPGIAVWALTGCAAPRARRLHGAGVEQDSVAGVADHDQPARGVPRRMHGQNPAGEVQKTELYDAWSHWSSERKISTTSFSRFCERIRSNAPYAVSDTYEKGGTSSACSVASR
jgi:putative DNA primase/helicase